MRTRACVRAPFRHFDNHRFYHTWCRFGEIGHPPFQSLDPSENTAYIRLGRCKVRRALTWLVFGKSGKMSYIYNYYFTE